LSSVTLEPSLTPLPSLNDFLILVVDSSFAILDPILPAANVSRLVLPQHRTQARHRVGHPLTLVLDPILRVVLEEDECAEAPLDPVLELPHVLCPVGVRVGAFTVDNPYLVLPGVLGSVSPDCSTESVQESVPVVPLLEGLCKAVRKCLNSETVFAVFLELSDELPAVGGVVRTFPGSDPVLVLAGEVVLRGNVTKLDC